MAIRYDDFKALRHFSGLDGVRALAIIAVVWHHSPRPEFAPILSRGFIGVDLFFVLSGFLITTLLLREKARAGRISLKNFWMRRILRLVPAYYALLFALLAAYLIFKPGDPDTEKLVNGFPIYALYLSNWLQPGANNLSITWSLATEEQFYLVWPVIEAFATPLVTGGLWLIALLINQLINFGVLDGAILQYFGVGPEQHPEILESTFTPILLGVGLAHIMHREKTFSVLGRAAGFSNAPIVFAIALVILLNAPVADISGPIRFGVHLLMTAWIASLLLAPASPITRGLEMRGVAYIGAVSYGMYLFHMWCIFAVGAVVSKLGAPTTPIVFIAGLVLTVIISALSFELFEKRFLALRKKFRQ